MIKNMWPFKPKSKRLIRGIDQKYDSEGCFEYTATSEELVVYLEGKFHHLEIMRDFGQQPRDIIVFRQFDQKTKKFTGRMIHRKIISVLRNASYLKNGYVVIFSQPNILNGGDGTVKINGIGDDAWNRRDY
jgi:hypothetical protein